jgi:hypothetical protein
VRGCVWIPVLINKIIECTEVLHRRCSAHGNPTITGIQHSLVSEEYAQKKAVPAAAAHGTFLRRACSSFDCGILSVCGYAIVIVIPADPIGDLFRQMCMENAGQRNLP